MEKTMKVTGGCHCGQITYEAEVDPATVRVCHCTDCQKLTGTAFRTNISSLPGTFVLKSGTPEDLHQDRRKREQARTRLLSRMRCTNLLRRARAKPFNRWTAGWRYRSACAV